MYICETIRKLKTRVKEHSEKGDKLMEGRAFTRGTRNESETDQSQSAITDQANKENHATDWQSAKIVEKEADWGKRGIREAIAIKKHPNNMNRDEGRYFLSHLYDDLLVHRKGGGVATPQTIMAECCHLTVTTRALPVKPSSLAREISR